MRAKSLMLMVAAIFLCSNVLLADVEFDFEGPAPLQGWELENIEGLSGVDIDENAFDGSSGMDLNFFAESNAVNQVSNPDCTPGEPGGNCWLNSTYASPPMVIDVGPESDATISLGFSFNQPSEGTTDADGFQLDVVSETGSQTLYDWSVDGRPSGQQTRELAAVPIDTEITQAGEFQFQVRLGDFDSVLTVANGPTGGLVFDSILIEGARLVPEPASLGLFVPALLGLLQLRRRRRK